MGQRLRDRNDAASFWEIEAFLFGMEGIEIEDCGVLERSFRKGGLEESEARKPKKAAEEGGPSDKRGNPVYPDGSASDPGSGPKTELSPSAAEVDQEIVGADLS